MRALEIFDDDQVEVVDGSRSVEDVFESICALVRPDYSLIIVTSNSCCIRLNISLPRLHLFVGWLSANNGLERAEDTGSDSGRHTASGPFCSSLSGWTSAIHCESHLQPHVVQGRFVGYQITGFEPNSPMKGGQYIRKGRGDLRQWKISRSLTNS